MNVPTDVPMNDLVESLSAKGTIGASDVLELRRAVFPDGVVSVAEADAIFRLDAACADKDQTWSDFYVEALTDFFVWQAQPRGYVDESLADLLMRHIAKDGRVDEMSELELLINIVDRATSCPERLSLGVMDAVRDSILHPQTAAYGSNRPPAQVTAADAAIVRKVIHAPGGDGSIAVTRREADFMFDLNDALEDENKAPEWDDVFIKAIACHLTSPMPNPMPMTAEAELKRQAWLEEKPERGWMLKGIGDALGRLDIPFGEAWREIDPMGVQQAKEYQEAEEVYMRDAYARETIGREEAAWLTERLGRDGTLCANELKLLAFIKEISPKIDPLLEPLYNKAEI